MSLNHWLFSLRGKSLLDEYLSHLNRTLLKWVFYTGGQDAVFLILLMAIYTIFRTRWMDRPESG